MNELQNRESRFCQADELIKAFHIMNNTELKFMFYALSKRKIGETTVQTTMTDLVSQLKIDWGGAQVETYKKAIKSIIQKSVLTVEMPVDRLSEVDRMQLANPSDTILVSGALISARLFKGVNDMIIDLHFNKDFIPMLDELKHDFTWIYLEQIARLNGKYSARMYEWCKMHLKDKDQCEFIWYLNSESKEAPGIRQWLNLDDKYKEYKAFNRRVLKPSFDEINECTSDIQVSCRPLRKGKKSPIYALHVQVSAKNGVPANDVSLYEDKAKETAKAQLETTNVTEEDENKEGTKKEKNETLFERLQRIPFQKDEQKELFDYIVDRYEYDIHTIKAKSTKADTIRKLMKFSIGLESYTYNTELQVALLDHFEQLLDSNPKFKHFKYTFEELDRLAGDDEGLKIDIVKQSLANGYSGLFPLRKKTTKTAAERLAELPF